MSAASFTSAQPLAPPASMATSASDHDHDQKPTNATAQTLASLELLQLLDTELSVTHQHDHTRPRAPMTDPDWLQTLHSRTVRASVDPESEAAEAIACLISKIQADTYPLDQRGKLLTDLIGTHLDDLTTPASVDALVGWLEAQHARNDLHTTIKVAHRDQAALVGMVGKVLGDVAMRQQGLWKQVLKEQTDSS